MATRSAKSTIAEAADDIHADDIRAGINGAKEEAAEDIDAIGDRFDGGVDGSVGLIFIGRVAHASQNGAARGVRGS